MRIILVWKQIYTSPTLLYNLRGYFTYAVSISSHLLFPIPSESGSSQNRNVIKIDLYTDYCYSDIRTVNHAV